MGRGHRPAPCPQLQAPPYPEKGEHWPFRTQGRAGLTLPPQPPTPVLGLSPAPPGHRPSCGPSSLPPPDVQQPLSLPRLPGVLGDSPWCRPRCPGSESAAPPSSPGASTAGGNPSPAWGESAPWSRSPGPPHRAPAQDPAEQLRPGGDPGADRKPGWSLPGVAVGLGGQPSSVGELGPSGPNPFFFFTFAHHPASPPPQGREPLMLPSVPMETYVT